jgi:hypothetical protein
MKISKDGLSNLITFRPSKWDKETVKMLNPFLYSWENENFFKTQILRVGIINYGTEEKPFLENPFSIFSGSRIWDKSSVVLIAEKISTFNDEWDCNFYAFFKDEFECECCEKVRDFHRINLDEFDLTMGNYKEYFEKIGEQILNKCFIQTERGEIFYNLFIPQEQKNV